MNGPRKERSPGGKFLLVILVGFLLAIPIFASWLLVYDRQQQSETARSSIVTGWGGPQTLAGPTLIVPYETTVSEIEEEDGKKITRTRRVERSLLLSPENAEIDTTIKPRVKQRSIYEAVVYEAANTGTARFILPEDFSRYGVSTEDLRFDRAELRFGLSDPKGLFGKPPLLVVNGEEMDLQPGKGLQETKGFGFFAWIDAGALLDNPDSESKGELNVSYSFSFRGNAWLSLVPHAGDMGWTVRSAWPDPSFKGGFLPTNSDIGAKGFTANYRVANLAIGQSVVGTQGAVGSDKRLNPAGRYQGVDVAAGEYEARVDLIDPVDFYDQVNRATKYGFLFIGFTFVTFLMFDIIGGVRISTVEYILVGAALVLFFVLLLALAEIIGFGWAYIAAAGSIITLITAYSSSVLKNWGRAGLVGALLSALYGAIYILLSIEEFSLLIGSILIFAALAGIMYLTRHLDWSGQTFSSMQHSFFDPPAQEEEGQQPSAGS